MMIAKPVLTLLGAAFLLGACAQSPEDIAPAYISEMRYKDWTCDQLAQEQGRLAAALTTASAQQDQARSNDIAGVILLGLPVASISGSNIAPEVARLKGERDAIERALIMGDCAGVTADATMSEGYSTVGDNVTFQIPDASEPAEWERVSGEPFKMLFDDKTHKTRRASIYYDGYGQRIMRWEEANYPADYYIRDDEYVYSSRGTHKTAEIWRDPGKDNRYQICQKGVCWEMQVFEGNVDNLE